MEEGLARHHGGAGLLLFDLDDTIVQSGSYVSPRVIAALKAAHDAGFVLAIASGRPRCMLDVTILRTGVMDYCVCANGATVHRLCDGSLDETRGRARLPRDRIRVRCVMERVRRRGRLLRAEGDVVSPDRSYGGVGTCSARRGGCSEEASRHSCPFVRTTWAQIRVAHGVQSKSAPGALGTSSVGRCLGRGAEDGVRFP